MRSLKICALSALSLRPAAAHPGKPSVDDIDDRIARVEAVFESTVGSARFVRFASVAFGLPSAPHTLVTPDRRVGLSVDPNAPFVYQHPMPAPAPEFAPNDPGHDDADRNEREDEPALR